MARKRNRERRDLPPNLYVRNNGYYSYRDPRTGKEYGLGRIKRDAVNQAIDANMQLMDMKYVKLAERIANSDVILFHDWLGHYNKIILSRGLKQKSIREYENKIRTIKSIMDNIPIDKITTKDIAAVISSYTERGKNTTAKLIRISLLDIFREAIAEGHISFNPVEPTRNPRTEVKRSRLSFKDYLKILESAKTFQPWMPLSMELALLTGQRISDICKMKWTDIKEGMLWVQQQKSGNKLAIDMTVSLECLGMSLEDVIKKCYSVYGGCDNLIASSFRKEITTTTVSRGFVKAREATSINWGDNPPSFHEIRSLAARLYTDEKGGEFAQRLLGHKSAMMTAKYQDNRGSEWVKVL
ncbi:tyrosine-type recombinase/integrase [Morganella morganii subsp. morganii]|nr:tyrosine-type recombinase/integrase [Morganella morganii]QWM05646.1 tyrosine-type recombinase/integrase [Morganella morganii subsp. morganii]